METIKKLYFDLETTGLNFNKNSIHQIAGLIEIDNVVVEEFNFRVKPHPKAVIEPKALAVCGVTEEQILGYPDMKIVYKKLLKIWSKYVDRFDRTDKFFLVGFNNSAFDNAFLEMWFRQNKDSFIMSWLHAGSLDAMTLASQYLIHRRKKMANFKLHSVAKELGIIVDKSKLHDASYDVNLTRDVYLIVTGLEIE